MPRRREENALICQAAREKILSAAMDVFIEQGYHDATINDIAVKAGVSKGLLYNYFKGKEDVLAEMVKLRIDEITQVMETAVAQQSPTEQLKHIVEGALVNVQQRPKVFRFFLHLQTQPEEDEVLAKYSKLLNQVVVKQFEIQSEMFARLVGEDPRSRSLYFSSCLQGIMLMLSTYPEHFPLQKVKEQIIREFFLCDE